MRIVVPTLLLLLLAALPGTGVFAQDPQHTGDQDGSSQQVEESDESFRRRMELEDARHKDPTYTDPANAYRRELEKIDQLPQESRDNIRDQLVDVIMENPEWEPGDALEEYPYEPTEAAKGDSELLKKEQEAWDEQIEKYHAREAEAFGAYRGQAGSPGNPGGQQGENGQQGGQQGSQDENGQQGGQGQEGGQQGSNGQQGQQGSAGTYQPQNGNEEDAESTEGVSESALDFLRGRQTGQAGAGQPGQQAQESSQQQAASQQQASSQQQAASQQSEQPPQPSQQQSDSEEATSEQDMRGIIAIEELHNLEGTGTGGIPAPPPEEEEDPDGP